jgi:hypothetical protein
MTLMLLEAVLYCRMLSCTVSDFTKPYYKSETLSFKNFACTRQRQPYMLHVLTTFAVQCACRLYIAQHRRHCIAEVSHLIIFRMKDLINYVDAAQRTPRMEK